MVGGYGSVVYQNESNPNQLCMVHITDGKCGILYSSSAITHGMTSFLPLESSTQILVSLLA